MTNDTLGLILVTICTALFMAYMAFNAGQDAEMDRQLEAVAKCRADKQLVMVNGYYCNSKERL